MEASQALPPSLGCGLGVAWAPRVQVRGQGPWAPQAGSKHLAMHSMLFPRLGGGSQVFLMQVFVPFDMPERVETPSGVRSSEGGTGERVHGQAAHPLL